MRRFPDLKRQKDRRKAEIVPLLSPTPLYIYKKYNYDI